MKRIISILLTGVLAIGFAGCVSEKKIDSDKTDTKKEQAVDVEDSAEEEGNSDEVEAVEPNGNEDSKPKNNDSSNIVAVENTKESPAKIGDWVETKKYNAVSKNEETMYFRITNIERGNSKVQDAIEAEHKARGYEYFKTIEDDNLEYCLAEYEAFYPSDYPSRDFGITTPDIHMNITTKKGGGIEHKGTAYIGLSTVKDVSDDAKVFPGGTFKGKAIFVMVKGVSEYLFESRYYDANSTGFSAYIQGK